MIPWQEDGFLDAEITGGQPPDVAGVSEERICIELMTSDCKFKASREDSK